MFNSACIKIERIGSTEQSNLKDFAEWEIQDYDIALEVVQSMLSDTTKPYEANLLDPEFYCRYSVTDADSLRMQMGALGRLLKDR